MVLIDLVLNFVIVYSLIILDSMFFNLLDQIYDKEEHLFEVRTCMKNRMCNQWANWRAYRPVPLL